MSLSPVQSNIDIEALVSALQVAVAVFDASGVTRYVNWRMGAVLGRPEAELVGLGVDAWRELVQNRFVERDPAPKEELSSLAAVLPAAPSPVSAVPPPVSVVETKELPLRIYECRASDISGADGAPLGQLVSWIDVTEAVRERERQQRELELLRARAEQAENFKMELTANVTHDLRTPLASIKASVSGLLAGDVAYDPAALRETLSVIDQETDRLQRRVQNLLSMARMEAGDANLARDWVDVADVIASAVESLRSLQHEREIRVEIPADLPLAWANYDDILIAVRNLLENAMLYSPAGTPIEVGARYSLGQVRVRVRDFGVGLAPDEFERIFDKFYRGRTARRIPGTGLGLPICRGIAEAHGGHLWAEHPQGAGVAFVFSIPINAEGEVSLQ